jgi:predicted amidophosphoribosyltransferase
MKRGQLKQGQTHYHLCPRCGRATPALAKERFCPNDGTKLLTACPQCDTKIASPYSRYCSQCGLELTSPPQPTKLIE